MDLAEWARLAATIAKDTISYLFAYLFSPVLAWVAAVALMTFGYSERWYRWAVGEEPVRRFVGAAALGLSTPLSRERLRANLRWLESRPRPAIVYLIASHGFTPYYFILIGPLLGKDVLLSHLLTGAILIVIATAFSRPGHVAGIGGAPPVPSRASFRKLAGGELARFAMWAGYGVLLGSLVGAWGLGPQAIAPVELVEGPLLAQITNAVLALAASFLSWMWPVSNLLAGTYLWKIGLAHAGLAAFFYGSMISPQRWLLYREVLGSAKANRMMAALALSIGLAGVATAALFGFADLSIRYKLLPEQIWQPR